MGLSISTAASTQESVEDIAQTFRGDCQFSCTNNMSDISVIIDNSNYKGNIDFSQACSVDGQCQISSATDATASTLFTAKNSAAASTALGNLDISSTKSSQDIRQQIAQNTVETCGMSSENNMSDILVFIENSDFTGNVDFSQYGNTAGSCALSNTMDATAETTGQSTNDAVSGKKAKTGTNILEYVGVFVVLIIVIILLVSIIRLLGRKKSPQKSFEMQPLQSIARQ